MIIDVTTDSIEVKLAAAHTTRALQFYVSYHIIDSTNVTFTPAKNFGSTNGTTAVTMVAAPSSGKLNQLRFCTIYNCDSVDHTVTVQVNSSSNLRTVYSVIVKVGEQIQFAINEGWKIFNKIGILKTTNNMVNGPATKINIMPNCQTAAGGVTQTSGTDYAYYMGKADRNYDNVTIQLQVTTALGATITWAEAAIYKGAPSIGGNVTLTRCGYVDVSAGTQHGVNATGVKTIVIPITDKNLFVGDDIWFVYGTVTTGTASALKSVGYLDNIGSGIVQSVTGSLRPSTNSSISFTTSSLLTPLFFAWHGTQYA